MRTARGFTIRTLITAVVYATTVAILQQLIAVWIAYATALFISLVVTMAMVMFNVGEAKR